MKDLVIDASVAFKWLVWEDGSEEAIELLEKITSFQAPDIFFMEIDAILSRRVRRGEMKVKDALKKRDKFRQFPCLLIPYNRIEEFAFRLATECAITLYHACYLAVAVDKAATLYTADQRFVNGLSTTPFADYVQYVGK